LRFQVNLKCKRYSAAAYLSFHRLVTIKGWFFGSYQDQSTMFDNDARAKLQAGQGCNGHTAGQWHKLLKLNENPAAVANCWHFCHQVATRLKQSRMSLWDIQPPSPKVRV
jgi:hypothetical protein